MVASAALVMALGILSTTQTDLAKALERQGIETWDLIRAGLRGSGKGIEDKIRKPLICAVGLALIMTGFVLLRGIRLAPGPWLRHT